MTLRKTMFKEFPLEGKNRGKAPQFYSDGLKQDERIRLSANDASDNGRCWWIYKYLTNNPIYGKKR